MQAKLTADLQQLLELHPLYVVNRHVKDLIRIESLLSFKRHAAVSGVSDDWRLFFFIEANLKEKLLLNIQFLLDVHLADNHTFGSTVIDILLAEHIFSRVSNLLDRVNCVDGSVESILFEVATCASFGFDLRFNDELTAALLCALAEVCAKRPCNVEGFLSTESDVAEGDGHSVPMHDLGSLILM